MPVSCRVISLCSLFLDSSLTFDTTGHLILHEKLPPLGLCGTNLFLHLAGSIRELVLIDPLFSLVSAGTFQGSVIMFFSVFPVSACVSLPDVLLVSQHRQLLYLLFSQSSIASVVSCAGLPMPSLDVARLG